MKAFPTIFCVSFVSLLTIRATAEECTHSRDESVTDDFFFTASSDQGAVGDVIAVDVSLTIENLRQRLLGLEWVLCYDSAIAEPFDQLQYSEVFDKVAGTSYFGRRESDSGEHGLVFSTSLNAEVLSSYFSPGKPVLLATAFFRLKGAPGDAVTLRFCDAVFSYPFGPCRLNHLYYVSLATEENPTQQHLVALSTRHVAGHVRVTEGEPTRPDPPALPPLAKVYPELPTAATSDIRFELSGAAVQPGAAEVPLDFHVTSNYEFSGFSVSLTFPPESLELARVDEHTRRGIVRIDNADGSLGMLMLNSERRLGTEGERVKIATFYFNVKPGVALGTELTPRFEARGFFLNWLAIRHTNGLNDQEPNTAQVEPLTVSNGILKIQALPTVLGDVNLDYEVNITDPVALLNSLFLGQSLLCPEAADFNADGGVNITDPVAMLNFLFLGGPAAPELDVVCNAP